MLIFKRRILKVKVYKLKIRTTDSIGVWLFRILSGRCVYEDGLSCVRSAHSAKQRHTRGQVTS